MARLAALGLVSGHLLFHGPTPVGYIYLVYRGDIVDFEYTGFDPAYRDRSPGSVLLMKVLEGLFAAGRYRIFDFGETEGSHKDTFSTHQIPSADIYYFRRRPKPLAAVAGQAGLHYLTRNAKTLLARAKLADQLKRAVGAVRA
jgi:CelD/BcsL family acetyltransferase involved in cellulose biosynthesis